MFIGLDLGTSGVKAMLIDGEGRIIASASAALTNERPHEGWSEQDPASWIVAADQVMDELATRQPKAMSAVAGIGLSGHMHGATLLDAEDKPLRPCMLWNDVRSAKQALKMDQNPDFRLISGNIIFPGFTAPKVAWVRENESEIFNKVTKILLPKDFLRLWLTGDYVSDMSDASGTSWLDVAKRDWSDTLLSACGLSRAHMPRLVEGSEVSGDLRSVLAAKWGMRQRCVVAGGGGDNAASAIGMGTVKKGQAFVSIGTSGVLFAANDAYLPNPESAVHAFCHALPDTWHQMGVILSAADSLNWWAKQCATKAPVLVAALGDDLKGPASCQFLPYLGGERTPHNNADIRGAFLGLGHGDDRSSMTHAVMDGVGYAFRDCMAALEKAGTQIARVTAIGGGSNARIWLDIIANVLNVPVDVPDDGDFGGAFGAARLGRLAVTGEAPEDICVPPKTKFVVEPKRDVASAYAEGYGRYTASYPLIKALSS